MEVNKFGLTGGIGSGKTYVSRLLEKEGFPIFNCDQAARKLMCEDVSLQSELSSLTGTPVITSSGELDKKIIGDYLFASPDHVRQVNALVHPLVRKTFLEWVDVQTSRSDSPKQWVGMECSILFEARFDDLVDFIISVYAPAEVRLQRVEQRDHLTSEQIKRRMARQLPEKDKLERSDFVIQNDGKLPLAPQLKRLKSILQAQ